MLLDRDEEALAEALVSLASSKQATNGPATDGPAARKAIQPDLAALPDSPARNAPAKLLGL